MTSTPTSTPTVLSAPTNTPTATPTATTVLPTNTPAPTATLAPGTLLFTAAADARVSEASPTSNFGTATTLQADGGAGTTQTSFIRFNVSGVSPSTIQSAKLRVYCTTNGTTNGPASYLADSNWTESGTGGVTWSTQPALLSSASDNKAAFSSATWVEYDVTALVSGDGTYTFALVADSTDGVTFSSREGPNAPQLLVTLAP
jgi:hypothetical protein